MYSNFDFFMYYEEWFYISYELIKFLTFFSVLMKTSEKCNQKYIWFLNTMPKTTKIISWMSTSSAVKDCRDNSSCNAISETFIYLRVLCFPDFEGYKSEKLQKLSRKIGRLLHYNNYFVNLTNYLQHARTHNMCNPLF